MTVADNSNAWDQDGSPAAATPDPPSSSYSLEPAFSSPPSSPSLPVPSIKIAPPLPHFPQVDSPIDSFDDFPADQPPEASGPAEEHVEDDDGFDDFDGPTGPSAGDAFGGDDDFGDFGDFDEEGEVQVGESFDQMYLKETPSPQPFVPPQSSLVSPLRDIEDDQILSTDASYSGPSASATAQSQSAARPIDPGVTHPGDSHAHLPGPRCRRAAERRRGARCTRSRPGAC